VRRLLLTITLLLLVVPACAGARKPPPTVVAGAAHAAGARVEGWFVVKDLARRPSRPAPVYVMVGDGTGASAAGLRRAPALRPGRYRRMRFSFRLPAAIEAGERRADICTGGRCLHVGRIRVTGGTEGAREVAAGPSAGGGDPGGHRSTEGGAGGGAPTTVPGGGPASPPTDLPTAPIGGPTDPPSVPTDPIAYPTGEPFFHRGGGAEYWAFVPGGYDADNQTAMPLLLWMHGCGGEAKGDAWVVGPVGEEEPEGWLTLSLGGRDGGCWSPSGDEAKVLAALADFETHFDVDRHRVILAGYSSGGDLAYRTGFRHSATFAGLLIENSSPFRDTESSASESLAAATTKLHIVHLAHAEDGTYPLAGVQEETDAVKAAGFPLTLIVRPGAHYDSHTDQDLREYLLPHVEDGWTSP
jgi:predicted esterase